MRQLHPHQFWKASDAWMSNRLLTAAHLRMLSCSTWKHHLVEQNSCCSVSTHALFEGQRRDIHTCIKKKKHSYTPCWRGNSWKETDKTENDGSTFTGFQNSSFSFDCIIYQQSQQGAKALRWLGQEIFASWLQMWNCSPVTLAMSHSGVTPLPPKTGQWPHLNRILIRQ